MVMVQALVVLAMMVSDVAEPSLAATATNETGLKLLASAAKSGSANVVLSPVSAQATLTSAWLGAAPDLDEKLGAALNVGIMSQASAGVHFRIFLKELESPEYRHNAMLWAAARPKPELVRSLKQDFSTTLAELPATPEAIAAKANQWVSAATKDRVREIVRDVPRTTRMILASACTFDAEWQTKPRLLPRAEGLSFKPRSGEPYNVETLRWEMEVPVHNTPDYTSVLLPYRGERFGLWVLLPAAEGDPSSVLSKLDAASVLTARREMKASRLVVKIPKFKIESNVELSGYMKAAGVGAAFEPGDRFPGYGPELILHEVRHVGMIEVDEHGTRAAAATAVRGGGFGGPTDFRADRPFVFFILDTKTGALVFSGVCGTP